MRCRALGWMAVSLALTGIVTPVCWGAERWGLEAIGPELRSAGPMALGPDGVLLVADPMQAAVIAMQTDTVDKTVGDGELAISDITGKIAEKAGVDKKDIVVNDLVVDGERMKAFLSIQISAGDKSSGQVWMADSSGVKPLEMAKLRYAKLDMPNPPEDKMVGEGRRKRNSRGESITGISYSDGRVLVSGLSADNDPSSVWEFQFPFSDSTSATNVEIYHAAHGNYEDTAAIRTFVTMNIGGKPTLLAGYTCTPLVTLPLDALQPGTKVRGTTVAELGNWNRPLDMLVYDCEGKTYVLMSNSARGMMRISTEGMESNEGLTKPVKGGGVAGQAFEAIENLNGVTKMDRLDAKRFVALVTQDENTLNLSTYELP
jgi:hypothetical protein